MRRYNSRHLLSVVTGVAEVKHEAGGGRRMSDSGSKLVLFRLGGLGASGHDEAKSLIPVEMRATGHTEGRHEY